MTLFQPAVFWRYLLSADFAAAAGATLWISLAALALGLVLAVAQEA